MTLTAKQRILLLITISKIFGTKIKQFDELGESRESMAELLNEDLVQVTCEDYCTLTAQGREEVARLLLRQVVMSRTEARPKQMMG